MRLTQANSTLDDQAVIIRVGRRYALAYREDGGWTVPATAGWGTGKTPGLALSGSYYDGARPLTYRTIADAHAEATTMLQTIST